MMGYMAVILEKDLKRGHDALVQWRAAARELADNTPHRLTVSPVLPRPVWAMAVRYSLFLLERRAPALAWRCVSRRGGGQNLGRPGIGPA